MNRKVRKSYKRPQVTQVKLVPEEATLSNCKEAGGGTGSGANSCLDPAICKAFGS